MLMEVDLLRNFFELMKIKRTIINTKSSKKALLIHGLFANGGYWLEYLTYFKDYKLIILDIDYFQFNNIQQITDAILSLIENELSGEVDIIVSHSFGTVLANEIFSSNIKYSFEICPVYSSKRKGKKQFINVISSKLKNNTTPLEIRNQLKWVDEVLKIHRLNSHFKRNRVLFFPENDDYFEYKNIPNFDIQYFNGDHFNIHESMQLISKTI